MVPVIGSPLSIILQAAFERDRVRFASTVLEVEAETGADRLQARLDSDQQIEAVFLQGLEAATRSGTEEKRRLLARVIAAAVLDDAQVDASHVRVSVLRDLDVPHFLVLERLRRAEQRHPKAATRGEMASQAALRQEIVDVRSATLSPIVAALERHGLVEALASRFIAGSPLRALTPFGRDLLADLDACRAEPPHV